MDIVVLVTFLQYLIAHDNYTNSFCSCITMIDVPWLRNQSEGTFIESQLTDTAAQNILVEDGGDSNYASHHVLRKPQVCIKRGSANWGSA